MMYLPSSLVSRSFSTGLSLETAAGDALDDVSLGEEKDDQDRDAGQHATGHDDRVVHLVSTLKLGEPWLQGEVLRAEEHVDRPQEVVPILQKAQHRHGRERGL